MLFFYIIDLISPPEGRNNSGANWRKRDVWGPVQGVVAVGEGRRESCGHSEAMTALCLTTVSLAGEAKREEFAVKRPMLLPFSPSERRNVSSRQGL